MGTTKWKIDSRESQLIWRSCGRFTERLGVFVRLLRYHWWPGTAGKVMPMYALSYLDRVQPIASSPEQKKKKKKAKAKFKCRSGCHSPLHLKTCMDFVKYARLSRHVKKKSYSRL